MTTTSGQGFSPVTGSLSEVGTSLINAPMPENEAARLAALRESKILDTAPEAAFDDITRLAAHICSTPTALVSLIDIDRQWNKSKVGMDATETPRDVAFCAHTIVQSDILIVPDTLTDKRFATNPLVTSDPHIRFYAGVPLITAAGYALGTLCVIDYVPRELTPQQVEAQQTLGRQVVRQIELRRNLADLQRTAVKRQGVHKKQLQFFKQIALGLASLLVVATGVLSYFGAICLYCFTLAAVYYFIHRLNTERQHTEAALEQERDFTAAVLDTAAALVVVLDLQGRIIRFNRACEQTTGYSFAEVRGKYFWNLFLISKEEVVTVKAVFENFRAGHTNQYENYWVTRNGARRLITWSNTALLDKQGAVEYLISTGIDITERKLQEALQQANEKLTNWVNELEQRNSEIALLREMSDVLQACFTVEEAYTAIAQFVQRLFPQTSGGIFFISASNLVTTVATWSSASFASEKSFTPHECWALRRGRAHFVRGTHSGLLCQHLHQNPSPTESLCVPMMAQEQALGMLYLNSQELGILTETKQQLASAVAEHIALSLANIKLRETLQNQSIRDPLTGLFNRRYMAESLEKEWHRCSRKHLPLSIIMLDVDHFKRFNDTFGHDAGDTVLRELGQFLQRHVRGSDIACRYGGEEFTLILPEACLDVTCNRAEQLREGIRHLNLQHHHQPLGAITISVGVASFPKDGSTTEAVLQAADAALYRAKKEGRDAVRLAS